MLSMLFPMLLVLTDLPQAPTTHERDDVPFTIQLLFESTSGGRWGLNGRDADHAVVAIAGNKNILVAYHTDRSDLNSTLRPKQVEATLFDYSVIGGIETWTYETTLLLGQADGHDPLGHVNPDIVKCERPDVIAVGDSFFVVWTRRYEGLSPPHDKHPAVLECAFIERDSANDITTVYDNGGASTTGGTGLGYILDDDYQVLECAGVPDAVLLDDGSGAPIPEVAVVYPAQTVFSSGSNLTRSFELRVATCSLDVSNGTAPISSVGQANLFGTGTVSFNGDDGMAAGVILPDLAQGLDSNQFILAFEEQFTNSGQDYGLIRLHRIARNVTTGVWSSQQSHTFGNSQSTLARRRPNLSTYDPVGRGVNNVCIAFNTYLVGYRNDDADVVFSEWLLDETYGIMGVQWSAGVGQPTPAWPNDPSGPNILAYDFRPVPLLGALTLRRCYAETFQAPAPPTGNCSLIEYDLEDNQIYSPPLVTAQLARPAVAYLYDDANSSDPHYIALTWEENLVSPNKWRIHLLVR